MKRQRIRVRDYLLVLGLVCLLLSGCAAGTTTTGTPQAAPPGSIEDLLVQAGFRVVPENYPLCQKICAALPPDSLVPQQKGGKLAYAYFSTETNKLYVGDEAAYQSFINLAVLKQVSARRRAVTLPNTNDPQFWQMWQDLYGGH